MTAARTVLFLQGPASPFLARVADAIERRGHRARRINLSPGDALFWRRPGAVSYRGRLDDFRTFVAGRFEADAVTDLVLLGDSRPVHVPAIAEAQARGIRVHAVEHGYLRPDWLTVERDGMSSFSHMPRDPEVIRSLAVGREDPDLAPLAPSSFLRYAALDLAFNLPNVAVGWATHPHYRSHSIVHPLVEYGGWLLKFARAGGERRHRGAVLAALAGEPRPTFLVPLQLATDFQIRTHSPFPHLTDAVRWIVRSFARHADRSARLLFKIHPIDNGLGFWRSGIARLAAEAGVLERVAVIDGGDLDALLAGSAGVVTVNSTVGITALRAGRPLVCLGNAVFDVPGIAHQGPLRTFWTEATPPDAVLARDFLRVLAWATQVRGGFVSDPAIQIGAENVAERVLEDGERLPRTAPQDRAAVVHPRRDEWLAERDL